MSLGRGLIFEMTEEFDELLDDEITTVTLTYTDDLIVPEIADREGIHIVEITNNRLVIEHTCSDDEVREYVKSHGLTNRPIKVSIEFCVYEDPEEENF